MNKLNLAQDVRRMQILREASIGKPKLKTKKPILPTKSLTYWLSIQIYHLNYTTYFKANSKISTQFFKKTTSYNKKMNMLLQYSLI